MSDHNHPVKMGRLIPVENKDRVFGSNPCYTAVWVQDAHGNNEECLLFTDTDIIKARARAQANPEDLTKRTLLTDLLD